MGFLFGLMGSIFALTFGLVGMAFALFFGLMSLVALGPIVVVLAILGILLWDPLLWIGLGLGIYLLYKLAHKKGYITVKRNR